MRVLVTGASGFIGRNVLVGLPRDWKIVATWHRDESFPDFLRANGLAHVEPRRVDLAEAADAARLAEGGAYDACVYLAANGDPARSVAEPALDLRANAVALVNVLAACRFGHFVFFSSGAVYDGMRGPVGPESPVAPLLPYAISKWASERYVLNARKQGGIASASVVRFFGAYGPHEPARKIYGRLVRQFAFERAPRFAIRGDGRNLIDAMYVDDAVRAVRDILERPGETRTLDLCSGTPLTLTELVTRAARRFGIEPRIEHVGKVPEYIEFRSADGTMEKVYGFRPAIALEDGLERFRAWMDRPDGAARQAREGRHVVERGE